MYKGIYTSNTSKELLVKGNMYMQWLVYKGICNSKHVLVYKEICISKQWLMYKRIFTYKQWLVYKGICTFKQSLCIQENM